GGSRRWRGARGGATRSGAAARAASRSARALPRPMRRRSGGPRDGAAATRASERPCIATILCCMATVQAADAAALARLAARALARADRAVKDAALLAIAAAIERDAPAVLEANAADVAGAREHGTT